MFRQKIRNCFGSIYRRFFVIGTLIILLFYLVLSFSTYYFLINVQGKERATNKLNMVNMSLFDEMHNLKIVAHYLAKHGKDTFNNTGISEQHLTELHRLLNFDAAFFVDENKNITITGKKDMLSQNILKNEIIKAAFAGKENSGYTLFEISDTKNSAKKKVVAMVAASPVLGGGKVKGIAGTICFLTDNKALMSAILAKLKKDDIVLAAGEKVCCTTTTNKTEFVKGTLLRKQIITTLVNTNMMFFGKDAVNERLVGFIPIKDTRDKIIGALGIMVNMQPIYDLNKMLQKQILLVTILLFLMFIGLYHWLTRKLFHRMRRLQYGIEKIANNELDFIDDDNPENQPDEVSNLISIINLLLHRIKNSTKELELLNEELITKNRELFETNEKLYLALDDVSNVEEIIYTLAKAVEAKDAYTHGHSERVAHYAEMIARNLNIDVNEIRIIHNAAILHDIGKIGISDVILNKPYRLSETEFTLVKKHAEIGAQILSKLAFAKKCIPYIRHHHEWFNGEGYPYGLKGNEIPLGARIIAVADAFDAMTSDRPYRKGMSAEDAIKILKEGAGKQWDAEIVMALFKYLEEIAS